MEMFPVILCLVAMFLWAAVWRRLARDRSIVWSWRLVGSLTVAILGAVAVPLLVAVLVR